MLEKYVMVPSDEYGRLLKIRNSKYTADTEIPITDNRDTDSSPAEVDSNPPDEIVSTRNDALPVNRILAAIPLKFRSKTQRLLEYLGDDITWNSLGELIRDDGNVIQGSHISDLVKDLYYNFKKKDLIGKDYFSAKLEQLHVPASLKGVPEKKPKNVKDTKKPPTKKNVGKERPFDKWLVL